MIKVLHVISDKNIGGAGVLLLNQLSSSDRKSFEYSVVLPRGSLLTPKVKKLGIETIESDLTLTKLAPVIRCAAPHVVHTHASAQARVAARLFSKAKTVNTRHCAPDGDFTVPLFKKTAIATFDKLFTDKTIATAHYVKAILISEGIPAEKISVIINGSIALKKLSDTERIEIRKTLGYSETDFLAGIVGRLEQEKGQEIFIEAARLCQSTAPQIKFLIAGSGSMEQRLKKQAQGLGNVKFLGFLPDVCEIMNVIDANVNCSYISETSSLSLSEGMSVGAIPVVSDCGGNRYLAKDCGIIIPPKNSLELANAIKLLSDDRQLLAKLGKKTQERFFNEFTAKAMTIQIEALYKKLM